MLSNALYRTLYQVPTIEGFHCTVKVTNVEVFNHLPSDMVYVCSRIDLLYKLILQNPGAVFLLSRI